MRDKQLHRARVVSSVAATVISLASGTNYVYSAWAPQFADRLHLSATQSNLIGLCGNLGMYSLGIVSGMLVDHKGPRVAVLLGSLLLAVGYFPFHAAYNNASASVGLMCFFSFLSGFGGCTAFAAAIKTSALNWPHHRGTATAFPLAAFGLSAFAFSLVGGAAFPGDTAGFLTLLAAGTSGLTLLGFLFLRVVPHGPYHAIPGGRAQPPPPHDARHRRTPSQDAKPRAGYYGFPDNEPGTSPPTTNYTNPTAPDAGVQAAGAGRSCSGAPSCRGDDVEPAPWPPAEDDEPDETAETSSLMSKASSLPGEILVQSSVDMDRSHHVDVRGWRLLRDVDFWQLFSIMGILSGIGLMTINNIGHDANALWKQYDDTISEDFIIKRQQMHVSILSIGSFSGRLLSGVGSDFLVKVLGMSRVWCLVVASCIFCVAQACALGVGDPHFLWLVSGLSGLGYGFLFGVFPSIVAEAFGIHGLSQNWGLMTLSPVASGAVFNQFYGAVFDRHSVRGPDGIRSCPDGPRCYRAAYLATLAACVLGLLVTLGAIRHQHVRRVAERSKSMARD